jgi:DNA-binding MarR family transcriptional regulator/N-acetylglutamate synthase-like GNAT family acetyltransferase
LTHVAEIRAFNRFYTGVIGVLGRGLLGTEWSLTEARVLFELAHADEVPLARLRRELGLDGGYLTRIVDRLERAGLAARTTSDEDRRARVARLTERGREAFALLDERSAAEVEELLAPLDAGARGRLVASMDEVRRLLERRDEGEVVLREPLPGDLGWVVARHGALYAREYGWDETFEHLVARIVADFAAQHDPARERAWIAEWRGQPVGSIFCVRGDDRTAKLRLLLVEPAARGLGVGTKLVDACVGFARAAGYAELVLWTNDVLADARRIYERAGFELVEAGPHRAFGHDLVEQTWRLAL